MARTRDNSYTLKNHADAIAAYDKVLKGYGELASCIPKKRINEEVSELVNYSPAYIGLLMQKHLKHGSR